MIITRKFTMSLDRRGVTPVVDAVQNDSHTRAVAITMTNEGRPWKIPDGTTAAVRFKKPDGKSGLYDTLPDNNAAYSIDGNVVTVTLAPEVLTAEGHVDAAVALYNGNDVLGTFPFIVNVAPNPAAGRTVSNNYYYLQTWDDVNEANAFLSGRVDNLGQAVYTGFRQVNEAVNGLHARVSILEQNPGGGGGGTGGSGGTGGVAVETDPTVPAWAKQPEKPTYTASEVGARPDTWTPTAQEVGALPNYYTPPNQTAEQVGADPKGTAAGVVSDHNTNTASHEDIRLLIEGLSTRLNALANSTDTDLDQMAELVAYIKNNKNLIDGITTSKVSVADIVNNLTTNVANKPLSAAQGVALKALIDAITVPTKVSQLTNDKGYLTEHQDISGKLDASALPTAIDTALAQAKASGEFDGEDGQRGTGLLAVTTAPSGYTTVVGGITPKYRMALSTIKTQAGVTEVLLGDTVRYSYYHYPIDYLDASYAYFTERVSIRGATGAAGANGKDYVLTEADKSEIAALVIEMLGGNPIFGVVDENNNIVVSGDLPDGTYSVKYEMENGSTVNIGNLVLDSNVYYTITNTLTQCTNSNSATKVVQGSAYSATITAKSGYELSSVKVTMGGTDISSTAVSGGKITISNVTGNIVITAVAEEKASEPVTTNITLTDGIRIGSDGTDRSATGFCATEMIDLRSIPKPCTINLTKALWCHTASQTSGNIRVYAKKADGTQLVSDTTKTTVGGSYFTVVDNTNGSGVNVTVTVTSNDVGYIRFSGWWSNSNYSDSNTDFAKANTKVTLTYTPN